LRKVETALPGVLLIEPDVLADARGFFLESYHQRKFAELGITDSFVQDNHSRSVKGTVRGLHYQLKFPQAKLCRVIQGEVLDVVVEIRQGSPNFGKWAGFVLSAETRQMIYVPAGFAHGFAVLSDTAEFLYKCSDFYHPEDERGVLWSDPGIGIDWQVKSPLLSRKDQLYPRLQQVAPEELPSLLRP
jgi:dTDP-4-dehydrorhamnose 3,5-epimerase